MKNKITFEQYRTIDLLILTVILVVTQSVITFAARFWYADQLYVISPVAAVVTLVMMRWSGWSAVHAVIGGLLLTVLSGGSLQHCLIYGLGNLFCMPMVWVLEKAGKERVRQDAFLSMTLAFFVQMLMLLGRSAVAALLGHSLSVCIRFVTTDLLSVLFTIIVIWIVRKSDGLFEDQKLYLLRINQEQKSEGREGF